MEGNALTPRQRKNIRRSIQKDGRISKHHASLLMKYVGTLERQNAFLKLRLEKALSELTEIAS